MQPVNGIHHITAIAGNAQENLDFYAGVLGMRLVKKSVNQDDPTTYHLFYADAEGRPGTDLTFFPWAQMAPPRMGHGLAVEVSLEVPTDSLTAWASRLERYGTRGLEGETRFGERVLSFSDPHGMKLALVERPAGHRPFTPWDGSPVAAEHQIRGLHGARLWERDPAATAAFLASGLGLTVLAVDGGWTRYGIDAARGVIDVALSPTAHRGAWGVGAVHHIAWSVDDPAALLVARAQVGDAGAHATDVIDRFWFKSVYFKEPGGVLFELATDGPGFAVDEAPEHLGESLVLPPFLEPHRAEIERVLPVLTAPRR